jgi:DNA-binding LacI/PurR family transcriptional regulator
MRFLQSKGVRVPQVVSVVSFDNTLEARGVGLSSFDFNEQAIVNSILNWLLKASLPGRNRKPGGVADEPGELVIRKSFAPVQFQGGRR